MAFYQKYRPKTFSDLIGEDHISKTLLEAIKSDKLSHAYLLTGPRGTGKTTTARLLAKAFNCLTIEKNRTLKKPISGEPCNDCDFCREITAGRAVDVIEIDAASHTKVDEIREIINNASIAPTRAKKKIYIIDEVHMLSNSSFNALLKTLEEPPNHVVFILATTEVQKLPATILSRTQRYDFKRISKNDIIQNLEKIATSEKINIEGEALGLIAVSAEGVHRDAIGLLEQIAAVTTDIKKEDVQNILGIAETKEAFQFLRAIFNANPEEGLKIAHRLYEDGIEMAQFNKEVVLVLRKILLTKLSKTQLFEDTNENIKIIEELAENIDQKILVNIIEIFIEAGQLLKEIAEPLLPIEMAVVESCAQLSTTNSNGADKSELSFRPPATGGVGEISSRDPSISVGMTDREIETAKGASDEGTRGEEGVDKGENREIKEISEGKTKEEAKVEEGKNSQLPTPNSELTDTVPVEVFQMTDDLWRKIIEKTKIKNSTLAALLRDAKPLEVSDGKIVLGVKFKFHKDKISEPKNSKLLEEIVSEITGVKKCTLSCKVSDFRAKPSQAFQNDEELQKAAEEIFS